ncbi:MAG TPA: substrate-binding domain-containing protein [Acidiferrobacterales bacterium]|jgi:hypothetical protein
MRKTIIKLTVAGALFGAMGATFGAQPVANGQFTIDSPPLLDWPRDTAAGLPDLTEETANRLVDLHGTVGNCEGVDLVLSTAGNYHMALRDLFYDVLLPAHGATIRNWYYSTSPPIAVAQIQNKHLGFGNLALKCVPQVVVAPLPTIETLEGMTYADGRPVTEGARFPVFKNRGNVILVKKGNPRHIKSVWDLGKPNVRVVMPHKTLEPGTFTNYSGTIYNIAANDPNPPDHRTAEDLFNSIFNNTTVKHKWLSGGRIHHREVPWSVAYGKADAGILFYHLALDAVRQFPDTFEIVPLGGTVDDPQPVNGNRVGAHFGIRINGDWNAAQMAARERLVEAYLSQEFTDILVSHGMTR